jgi:hypothetical protein
MAREPFPEEGINDAVAEWDDLVRLHDLVLRPRLTTILAFGTLRSGEGVPCRQGNIRRRSTAQQNLAFFLPRAVFNELV